MRRFIRRKQGGTAKLKTSPLVGEVFLFIFTGGISQAEVNRPVVVTGERDEDGRVAINDRITVVEIDIER
jgi:hypothetical protein